MDKPPIDVDRVVREVLADLGARPGGTGGLPASVAPPVSPSAPAAGPAAPTGGELAISARVVTLSEVEGRLETVRRLVVPPQAVVTPAVHDELIRRNVTLAYASEAAARQPVPVRLVLVTAGKRFDPAPLVSALMQEGIEVDQQRCDCLIAATDRLAAEIAKPETLGVLLTPHTAAGLCLANRLGGVRAVLGTDSRAASTASASVGANLLVVDPTAASLFQLRRIATEFCRAGIRQCPEAFKERLA